MDLRYPGQNGHSLHVLAHGNPLVLIAIGVVAASDDPDAVSPNLYIFCLMSSTVSETAMLMSGLEAFGLSQRHAGRL